MQINITGHHVELTEALNDYVRSKFDKLERHFDNITNAQVTLSVEKQRQQAEADVHIAGGQIFATHEHDDMYAAIDGLIDKLDRQIIKHKEKMKAHK
ncbi:ribosome hibernation promoting factor [Marinobacterium sp. D7]|uniref:Ribosome hibernation promoting factor n=2 Tax=Marinobacterium TaxID=48075 RepID=A0A081FXK9_9GAMM|nr:MULTISPECIES: ribosome hibernation promoting factor [Marinobacterium]KEA63264.1 Ribosome hibernation protein YhbH [Marinobacterium lacunae]MBR9882846.1 ribosome hibernation promoting factor [Oceanospirillales bacterium]MBV1787301.1 ribosome hibernation promoting factor [Marinobacterium ramblicola]GGB83626.1 ribosomal subunit interface protein [Marinobacterium zhoushanense]